MTTPSLFLPDTEATRHAVMEACHWMAAKGLVEGTAGNISVRVEAGLLVTPSGVPYDVLAPDMLQLVPHAAEPKASRGLKPTSEWRFHQSVLAARTDMVAIVHAHPPYATALAVQRRVIPACHYMVAAFGGNDVPLVDYALFGSANLARDTARAMQSRMGCLLANHGAVTAGETLERALWRMQELETLARVYTLALASGTPVILPDIDVSEALEAFKTYGMPAHADE
ncbi:MAG: class II aldolase/adducin family protein [Pseudomonadota bacterium]